MSYTSRLLGLTVIALAVGCGGKSPSTPSEQTSGASFLVGGSSPLRTIQAGLDAARPGDTIMVSGGTYRERLVITKTGITLQGEQAIVDGASNGGAGIGIRLLNVTGVTLTGFTVRNFERGIVLENAKQCRVRTNETRDCIDVQGALDEGDGIVLIASQNNEIRDNNTHLNGHDGIFLTENSSNNVVAANRVAGNGVQRVAIPLGGCGIETGTGANNNNQIIDNQVLDGHWGIRIGPAGASTGNLIARNRAANNLRAGVAVRGLSNGNTLEDNNAAGNGLANIVPTLAVDLFDDSTGGGNIWRRNTGRSNF